MRIIVLQICIRGLTGERTVKRLRLSKALTVPETTTIIEACRRMAARRVDALLLTDSNALLCGILTDKVLVGGTYMQLEAYLSLLLVPTLLVFISFLGSWKY